MTHAKLSQKNKIRRNRGIFFLNTVLVFAVIGLAVFYVFQVNDLVGVSFKIRWEKEKLDEETVRNQKFETAAAQLKSPLNLEEMIKSSEMVEAGKVDYLKIEREMAVKK